MTRKRFSKIQKAVMIYVVNKEGNEYGTLKRLNKFLYKADYGTGKLSRTDDWLRNDDWLRATKLYSYQAVYELLLENVHKEMLKEGPQND